MTVTPILPLPSAGANEREPRPEEVEAVARAIDPTVINDGKDVLSGEDALAVARVAIKALDEHRAAEAPNRKD
jgi:hypothetical protein